MGQDGDECGGGLANIGDLNLDFLGQKRVKKERDYPTMPDLMIGCPQGRTGTSGGKIIAAFLQGDRRTQSATGNIEKYREFPFNKPWTPTLSASDRFGQSITSYYDVDNNGINDFVVGAPGDDADFSGNITDTGAIYLVFIERIPYEWPIIDLTVFYVLVTVLPGCYCLCCIAAIISFLHLFRHQEDEVEKIAKEVIGNSSVNLGESFKSTKSMVGRSSSKIFAADIEENKDSSLEEPGSRPGSAKSDGSDGAQSAKSGKRSSKKKQSLVYHRQKTTLQTYSRRIDDYDDDERVDEYF